MAVYLRRQAVYSTILAMNRRNLGDVLKGWRLQSHDTETNEPFTWEGVARELKRRNVKIEARTYGNLESNKTKTAKPNVVAALSDLTFIPVIDLVEAMGYPVERPFRLPETAQIVKLFESAGPILRASTLGALRAGIASQQDELLRQDRRAASR